MPLSPPVVAALDCLAQTAWSVVGSTLAIHTSKPPVVARGGSVPNWRELLGACRVCARGCELQARRDDEKERRARVDAGA